MPATRLVTALVALLLVAAPAAAQDTGHGGPLLRIETEVLGDTVEGIATRLTFHYEIASDGLKGIPYILGSAFLEDERVRSFRLALRPGESKQLSTVLVLPEGKVEVEARLLLETDDGAPQMIAKASRMITVASAGAPYVATVADGAEAVLAEGYVPESAGAVKMKPPKRDVAPNLFIVEAEVEDPVRRVEFRVDGKKIMTRNAPPYRVELDLGTLPTGVEVKVIGYDRAGRFVDTDAWIVNERSSPLEARISRTDHRNGSVYLEVSVQGNAPASRVELWLGERKIAEWKSAPYAVAVEPAVLAGAEYVRATAYGADGIEATDLLYLSGDRYFERVEVNLVQFPVTVLDSAGRPVTDLDKSDFVVREDGKPVELAQAAFSENLPLAVGVLVDHSGSMRERIEDAKQAALGFLSSVMRDGDRGFMGGFAWETQGLSPLVSDAASLRLQVEQMSEAEGATALYDAIVSGLYLFRDVDGRKALIIVSDGEDTASRISQEEMIRYVRASRVPLYFIGIGMSRIDFVTNSKLRNLAEETGGITFFVRDVEELGATYDMIEAELRSQYLLGYYVESRSADQSYRKIDVEVPSRRGVTVRSIRGYIQ